jgi:hypothetical protein
MLLGDAWVDNRTIPRYLRAVSDPLVHGAVAAIIMSMIRVGRPEWSRWTILVGVAVAMSIDIDHAIAAGSIDVYRMITLPMRPPTHSLTFALAAATLIGFLSRSRSVFALVFVALASHVLRDAYTGELLFYPAPPLTLPYLWYVGSELILAGAAAWLTPAPPPRWNWRKARPAT